MSKRQHPNNPEYADAAFNALVFVFIFIVFFKFFILIIEQQRQ